MRGFSFYHRQDGKTFPSSRASNKPSRLAPLFTPGTRQNALHGLLFPERYKVSSRLEKNDSRAVLAGLLFPREAENVVTPPLGQFYPFFPISGAVIYPPDGVCILMG